MPLLTSPIDGSPMKQIHRFGIELDICPTSGGIWLDRGELEKLINLLKESAEEDYRHQSSRKRESFDDDDYYRHDHKHRYSDDDYRKGYYKKKSGMSKVMDLFDF